MANGASVEKQIDNLFEFKDKTIPKCAANSTRIKTLEDSHVTIEKKVNKIFWAIVVNIGLGILGYCILGILRILKII